MSGVLASFRRHLGCSRVYGRNRVSKESANRTACRGSSLSASADLPSFALPFLPLGGMLAEFVVGSVLRVLLLV